MLKKIQKYLLVHHPLLWNTKIVPLSFFLVLANIIFFMTGFIKGALDFNETEAHYRYRSEDDAIVIFSIMTAVLVGIIWMIFYFKNNSFKSFYPKNNYCLYKEWLIILLGSTLLCSFPVSFMYGKDVRVRSYFSENEAKSRCETLSLASMFTEGSSEEDGFVETDSSGYMISVPIDHILYKGRKYPLNSLLNKNIQNFSFFDQETDSLNKIRIKNWLAGNEKDSVAALFKKFLNIASDHHLSGNINKEKWLDLVYHYPDFEESRIVANTESRIYINYDDVTIVADHETKIKTDTLNEYVKIIDGEKHIFNKYYVPGDQLNFSYNKISDCWTHPEVSSEIFFVTFFVALCFSILIFSFRISTARNWLISLVSAGIINIIFGVITAFSGEEVVYCTMLVVVSILLFIYFLIIVLRQKTKEISGIIINLVLWSFPFLLPLTYFLILELLYYWTDFKSTDYLLRKEKYPVIYFMKESKFLILYIDIFFILFGMLFFSFKIKKWKGIAER